MDGLVEDVSAVVDNSANVLVGSLLYLVERVGVLFCGSTSYRYGEDVDKYGSGFCLHVVIIADMRRRECLRLAALPSVATIAGCGQIAEIRPGDNRSNTQTATPEPAFAVREVRVPEAVTQPTRLDVAVEVENISETDGTFTETANFGSVEGGTVSVELTHGIELEIPAGETRVWKQTVNPDGSGIISFSVSDVEREIVIEPASKAPRIEFVELVSEWEEFGDVREHAIDSASQGDNVGIVIRYEYWHDDGTLDIFIEVELRDAERGQVGVLQDQSERLSDTRGWGDWERFESFSTDRLERDTYEAIVQVRDNISGEVSDPQTTSFEIT